MTNYRTLNKSERAYKNMRMVAEMLEWASANGAEYKVRDVYLDYGQDWMWTTIVREGYNEAQVLYPSEWGRIVLAESLKELLEIVFDIRTDKFFGDK